MDVIAKKPQLVPKDPKDIKDKLREKLASGGAITSTDVATFAKPEGKAEIVSGDVKTQVPPEAMKDPIINGGAKGDAGKVVQSEMADSAKSEKLTHLLGDDGTTLPEVTITEADRKTFLESVVTGKRFVLPFSMFDGMISGKFRSRSQKESQAIIAQLNGELAEHKILTALDYSTRLRNMVLAAQVETLRNTQYVELQEPMFRTKSGKDNIAEPGWLKQVEGWEAEHEGLVSALYNELQVFERKYWTMVRNAGDQNFWRPAGSISA